MFLSQISKMYATQIHNLKSLYANHKHSLFSQIKELPTNALPHKTHHLVNHRVGNQPFSAQQFKRSPIDLANLIT